MKLSKMRLFVFICFYVMQMLMGQAVAQTTWYVSPSGSDANLGTSQLSPFLTLTNAITNAAGGDLINLLAGTHVTSNEVVVNKAVTICGVDGAVSTIVRRADVLETFRVFQVTTNAVLRGITISNGNVRGDPKRNGGGLLMTAGLLCDSIVSGNYCGNNDGHGETEINGSSGAGLFISGNTVVSNCIIRNNVNGDGYDAGHGGGIYLNSSTCLLIDCVVTNNRATSGYRPAGGGVYVAYGNVDRCVITGNRVTGGIQDDPSHWGGGAGLLLVNGTVRNCLIAGNSMEAMGSYRSGGGVWSKGTLENCTVVRNYSTNNYGGVYRGAGAVRNCIIVSNLASSVANIAASASVTYSCAPELDGTWSNIGEAPSFKDSGSGYGLTALLGDYRLGSKDACLNSGTNLAWMATGLDLVHEKRIIRGLVDMGAYESLAGGGTILFIR